MTLSYETPSARPHIGGGAAVVVVSESIARSHDISGGGLICVVYPDGSTPEEVERFIEMAGAIKDGRDQRYSVKVNNADVITPTAISRAMRELERRR